MSNYDDDFRVPEESRKGMDLERIERAVREILIAVGEDPDRVSRSTPCASITFCLSMEKHTSYMFRETARSLAFRRWHVSWIRFLESRSFRKD